MPSAWDGLGAGTVIVASAQHGASGLHGIPVAVGGHTVTGAPAIGCPEGPNTMSSFLEPCAATGPARQASPMIESTAIRVARFIMFTAPLSFLRRTIVFIPPTALEICTQLAGSILSLLPHLRERKAKP